VIFQEKLLNALKCYNFLWVQRRHNCSPAASFANCGMSLYLLKVHLQTFLSIPVTQKCQISSYDSVLLGLWYVRSKWTQKSPLFWWTSACGFSVVCIRKKGSFSLCWESNAVMWLTYHLKIQGTAGYLFDPDKGDGKKERKFYRHDTLEFEEGGRGSIVSMTIMRVGWFRPLLFLLIPPPTLRVPLPHWGSLHKLRNEWS